MHKNKRKKVREARYNVKYKNWSECVNKPRYLEDRDEVGVERVGLLW